MGQYSKEEIAGFNAKDLRINKVAVIKSLIESGRNSANEVEENCDIVGRYVKFIYSEVSEATEVVETQEPKQSESGTNAIDWHGLYTEGKISQPTDGEKKILDLLWIEYEKLCPKGKVLNPVRLCVKTIGEFGKYPTSKNSVSKVMKVININQILN